jgi:ABC-2 type transport system permease protein
VGLSVTPRTADSLVPLVFPVSMISNSFVPTAGMPAWLRLMADWNPVSAGRGLPGAVRQPPALPAQSSLPMRHPVAMTIGWSLLLLGVFVPLSARRYRTAGP